MIKLVEILFEIREFNSVGDKGIREIRDTRTQGHGNHGSRQWMVRRDNGRSQTQSPPAMTPPTLSAFCLLPSAFPALPRINFDLILGIKCTNMHNHSCCGRQLFPGKLVSATGSWDDNNRRLTPTQRRLWRGLCLF